MVIRPEPSSRGSGHRNASNNSNVNRHVWIWSSEELRSLSKENGQKLVYLSYKWTRAFIYSYSSGLPNWFLRQRFYCFVYQENRLLHYENKGSNRSLFFHDLAGRVFPNYGEETPERSSGLPPERKCGFPF